MSPSGHVRLCYLGLNWSKTMTWFKTWRRWASLACLRRLPISLAWPLKEFPWTGWAILNRWQIIMICDPFSHLDILLTAHNTSCCFKVMYRFWFLSVAEAPRNHHCEWRGNRSCCSDSGGLHAALLSDSLRRRSPFPLPDLRAPHGLPRVHGPGGQSLPELNKKLCCTAKLFMTSLLRMTD